MKQQFPTDRVEKRHALLAAVDSVRDILAANATEAEAMRTLSSASVVALRESGLLALMLPAVLGGAEADPGTQVEVMEAVSAIDPSTGWSFSVGATAWFCRKVDSNTLLSTIGGIFRARTFQYMV